jgi:hypothetical protein
MSAAPAPRVSAPAATGVRAASTAAPTAASASALRHAAAPAARLRTAPGVPAAASGVPATDPTGLPAEAGLPAGAVARKLQHVRAGAPPQRARAVLVAALTLSRRC